MTPEASSLKSASSESSFKAQPVLGWVATLLLLSLGCWLMALCWHEWLSESVLSANFDCEAGRRWLIKKLGGRLLPADQTGVAGRVPFENVLISQIAFTLLWWLLGAAFLSRRLRSSYRQTLLVWGSASAVWWLIAGSWTVLRMAATLTNWTAAVTVISNVPELWLSFASSGWLATFVCLGFCNRLNSSKEKSHSLWPVWLTGLGIAIFTVTFGTMNTILYQNLLVPHGDSAMYEEHLWNLLHGKGFRSFIDQGLFLGEHIQVIHLGLIPVYLLWPSHLLLEWCQSLGLALGAIPVYLMTLRHSRSRWQASCLACAYLLYIPMQRLDISIDFKTFRPEAFGIPLLLAAFDALDAKKWRTFAGWLIAALLVKEDYALIIGPLGIWMALTDWSESKFRRSEWKQIWPGLALSLGAVLYLIWAVKIAIPYFKAGNQVHYVKYYSRFGETANEIIINLLTRPDLLWTELVTPVNFLFAASLIMSLAFLPLFSPGRLMVGLPLFGALCLNEIARNTQHHFHAPLVAIVFWAAAAGPTNFGMLIERWLERCGRYANQQEWARFAAIMTLFAASGFHFWHGFDPGSLPFWDSYSGAYWKKKYVVSQRAIEFPHVADLIPSEKRVAATDFVHPRFNHHDRCYDYSGYRPNVPDDAEYLVIDVHGPYSEVALPWDVEEYRQHPERWKLLHDQTHGQFFIFQRQREETTP